MNCEKCILGLSEPVINDIFDSEILNRVAVSMHSLSGIKKSDRV